MIGAQKLCLEKYSRNKRKKIVFLFCSDYKSKKNLLKAKFSELLIAWNKKL